MRDAMEIRQSAKVWQNGKNGNASLFSGRRHADASARPSVATDVLSDKSDESDGSDNGLR